MLRFRRGYEASQINGRNKQTFFEKILKSGDFLTGLYEKKAKHLLGVSAWDESHKVFY